MPITHRFKTNSVLLYFNFFAFKVPILRILSIILLNIFCFECYVRINDLEKHKSYLNIVI